jgi:2-keto-3-deoxy-L-rhamnonate aldolase RhmA
MTTAQCSAKEKLMAGRSIRSCSLGIPHPALIEILGNAGFDAVTLDCEHSAIGVDVMEFLLLASRAAGVTPFWRIGKFNDAELNRALDVGYTHFVVAHISSPEDAERVVRSTRYPPRGTRGVGPARATRYGMDDPREYFSRAESEILVALMIEEPEAVDTIDEIVAVDGVELVQLGFWDLSVRYGLPFQERHPRLIEAAQRVLDASLRRNVWVGVPPVCPEDLSEWEAKGARYFECASATGLFAQAAHTCVLQYGLSKNNGA